jgi:predicted nucleotidyltransferase
MKLARMNDISVFTSQQREQIRAQLVAAAQADERIAGAAHFGSAALGSQDRWSDIDLGLCLANDVHLDQVLTDWTTRLYRDHAAVANYDVRRGEILDRVFLLENTLQIDLSFWPAANYVLSAQNSASSLVRLKNRFQRLFPIQGT